MQAAFARASATLWVNVIHSAALWARWQAAYARVEREHAEAIYNGTAELRYSLRPLPEELPGTDVTLVHLKHLAAVIGESGRVPYKMRKGGLTTR